MLTANLVGYVFQSAEQKVAGDKTFYVMKIRVLQTKNSYIFVECYLNEGIYRYAKMIEKDALVYVFGDLTTNAYNNKQNEASPKVTCQVKHIKSLTPKQKSVQEEKPLSDFEW